MFGIVVAAAQHTGDDIGQIERAREWPLLAAPDDGRGDRARAAFLAQPEENVGQLGRLIAVDDIGGADAFARHAHVERAVAHEGKAALGLVQLHG
jgi:hypothetical protein